MGDSWGPFYERIGRVMQHHGPAIREAASQGRLHLADTTIDEIFNLEDHLHGLRRGNYTMDLNAHQINHSNHSALPSDTSTSTSNSLQTVRINKKHVRDDLNCAICLDQFQLDLEVQKTQCKHMFHHDCIVPWLAQRNSCPICRRDMQPRQSWWQSAFSFLQF